MSDCNWQGTDIFGTLIRGPGATQLPSSVLSNAASASIEHAVTASVTSANFFDVPKDGTTSLGLSISRRKGNHPLLVSLNLSGLASLGGGSVSPVQARVQFQTLVKTTNLVRTQVGDSTNQLLVASSSVTLNGSPSQPRFSGFSSVLVGPELLPADDLLDFKVQCKVESTQTVSGLSLVFDPKQDALVVQEIGPVSLV